MRNIKARFKKEEAKYPFHGSFIHLVKAVRGQCFSRQSLLKAFNNLIPKEEYNRSEKKELIDFLELITNTIEEIEKQCILNSRRDKK